MKNRRIIVGTHGIFGEEIINSAKLILGESDLFQAVSLLPEMSLEDYLAKADQVLAAVEGEILVFVDLLGGTPSNVFSILSKKYDFPIVTGVNLPVLLDIYFKAGNEDFNPKEISKGLPHVITESSVLIESKFE